jgi:hypothetical protein
MAGGGMGTGKSGIVPADEIVDGLDDIDITGDVTSSSGILPLGCAFCGLY